MLSRWNTRWSEFDDLFAAMDQLRSHMDSVFENTSLGRGWEAPLSSLGSGWPKTNLVDAGTKLVLTAEVPGLSEKDLKLHLNQEVLTFSGERKTEVPEGYSTHRQERPSVQFSRSFRLPCSVDPERTSAVVKNGILTVSLEKATEALPRQIPVKAS